MHCWAVHCSAAVTVSIGISVLLRGIATWLGVSVYRAYKRKGAVPGVEEDEEGDGGGAPEAAAKERPERP